MDNNFNMQQNNVQQPMGQPVYLKPRKRRGWIAGLIFAALMLMTIVITTLLYIAFNDFELEGTWSGYGIEIKFTETHKDGKTVIYEYEYIDKEGNERITTCKVKDDKITFCVESWDDELQVFIYEYMDVAIEDITSEELVLEYDGEEYTLERKK